MSFERQEEESAVLNGVTRVLTEKVVFVQRPEGGLRAIQVDIFKKKKNGSKQ